MSKMWEKGTYHYERCAVCGHRIRVLNDDDYHPVPNYRYDNYIVKIGSITTLQAGYICRKCLAKPVQERINFSDSLIAQQIISKNFVETIKLKVIL